MAAKKVDIMELKQLLRLKEKGESNRSSARKLRIHRNTINHYVRLFLSSGLSYRALLLLDDKTLQEMFPELEKVDPERYKILSGYFTYFRLELKKPGCTRETLWKEYVQKHPGSIIDVEASRSQKKEDFIATMNRCLMYFEGVPKTIVTDNLKSAVNKAIREKLIEYNNYLMKRLDISRIKQFLDIEKPYLGALPAEPYEIKEYKKATVSGMGYIFLNAGKNYYTVPYRYIGKVVEIQYNSKDVEIYYRLERIAFHKRSYIKGYYTKKEEHLSSIS